MDETSNIKTATKVQVDLPSLIIDKSSRIIAQNSEVKKIIPTAAPNTNFFELFDEQNLLSLQRIFIDARKFEIVSKDVIELKIGDESKSVEVVFTPLRSENNIYFLINLRLISDKKLETETKKFWIATPELDKITNDKRILALTNKVKLTYPFTFIEKAKIQKEINELDQFFWIKETNGKYIIANDNYASSIGFTTSQLENKNEEDFLPKYLASLYNFIDQYIIKSANTVILESATSPITTGAQKAIQIVEFPICDLDNKVVAIIGFSQKVNNFKTMDEGINPIFYKNITHPVLLLDSGNNISAYSNEFIRLMLLNEKTDYKKQSINKIFEKDFIAAVEEYLKNT